MAILHIDERGLTKLHAHASKRNSEQNKPEVIGLHNNSLTS